MYWTAELIEGFLKLTPQYLHKTSQSVTAEAIRLRQLRLNRIRTEFPDCYMHQDWMFPTRKIKIFERIRCPSHYGNWSPGKRNKTLWRCHCHTSPSDNTKCYILFVITKIQTQLFSRNFFLPVISSRTKYKHRFVVLFCLYKRKKKNTKSNINKSEKS
jgi:hypothetical protein